jgi:hypothetical protein
MSDDPRRQPHPLYPKWTVAQWEEKLAEDLDAEREAMELTAAESRVEGEANEEFRSWFIAAVARHMRGEGASEAAIAEMERDAMDKPNAYWGEVRERRRPPGEL